MPSICRTLKITSLALIALFLFAANSLSHAAERIPGTKITLTPPSGFEQASQFPGYMMLETGASIMVSEMAGAPVAEVTKDFTKEAFTAQGMNLIEKQTVSIASGNALLIHASQTAHETDFLKWLLIFGDNSETVLITATFPSQHSAALSEQLKAALLSAKQQKGDENDFYEGLTFKVEEFGDLKIANKMGNNIFLTRNGVFPQENPADPLVVVGASFTESWSVPGDKTSFAKNRLMQIKTIPSPKTTSEKQAKIDGLETYIIEAEGKDIDTGQDMYILQGILFTADGYYILQGLVDLSAKPQYAPVFTSVLSSFDHL